MLRVKIQNRARHIASHKYLYGLGYFVACFFFALWARGNYPAEMKGSVYRMVMLFALIVSWVLTAAIKQLANLPTEPK